MANFFFPYHRTNPSISAVIVTHSVKKWEIIVSANIKNMKGAKHKKLEKALAKCIRQLNDKNAEETDEVIKEWVKMVSKY
jgi:hypothetical protein